MTITIDFSRCSDDDLDMLTIADGENAHELCYTYEPERCGECPMGAASSKNRSICRLWQKRKIDFDEIREQVTAEIERRKQ